MSNMQFFPPEITRETQLWSIIINVMHFKSAQNNATPFSGRMERAIHRWNRRVKDAIEDILSENASAYRLTDKWGILCLRAPKDNFKNRQSNADAILNLTTR